MDPQNLAYALTQILHNFGAVAVTGGAAAARWFVQRSDRRRTLAWLVLAGWATQAASGALFGAISHAAYGQFPDIHGIALAALVLKMGCAATGFGASACVLTFGERWSEPRRTFVWSALLALAAIALCAAAFLRWFS